ncbi:MAG: metallophosphoesterase family protein [Thermoproteota archaeon]
MKTSRETFGSVSLIFTLLLILSFNPVPTSCESGVYVTIYHISDTHISRSNSTLIPIIDYINSRGGDLVNITGDLTEHGFVSQYECAKEALAKLTLPYLILSGNNDDNRNMKKVFGYVNSYRVIGDWLVIAFSYSNFNWT